MLVLEEVEKKVRGNSEKAFEESLGEERKAEDEDDE